MSTSWKSPVDTHEGENRQPPRPLRQDRRGEARTFANALPGTIIPPFEPRAKAVRARSISPASRTLIGFTSTPSDGAAVWMAPNWPIPAGAPGSRRTAARVTPGAICLSSSSHLALRPYSKFVNPVALPPGRARLSTKPLPTGSTTCTNTIGTARVVCSNGAMLILPVARMTSGVSANNSSAYLRISSEFPAAGQRVSMRRLRPSVKPQLLQSLLEGSDAGLSVRTISNRAHEHADLPYAIRLLRARRKRPTRRRAADQRDELAPPQER